MFFSQQRWVAAGLTVTAACIMFSTGLHTVRADQASDAQPSATDQGTMSVNDPQNPLHLTSSQQITYVAVKVQYQKDATAVMESKTIPDQQKQLKIRALQIADMKKLRAVLTPTQIAIQDSIIAQQRNFMLLQQKAQSINQQLFATLSPKQKNELSSIRSSAQAKATAIQNSSASRDVKMAEIGDLRKSYSLQLASVPLSPSQHDLVNKLKQIQLELELAQRSMSPQAVPPPQQ
jgi:hypothetical protein